MKRVHYYILDLTANLMYQIRFVCAAKRRSAAQEDQEEIFIVQRYIMSPLVLPGPTGRGHKFGESQFLCIMPTQLPADMRVYFYIANVKPMLSFMFNDGYLRVRAFQFAARLIWPSLR